MKKNLVGIGVVVLIIGISLFFSWNRTSAPSDSETNTTPIPEKEIVTAMQ